MPAYVFEHEGKQFTPDGAVSVGPTKDHNREIEAEEIRALKEHPERLFLYVKHPPNTPPWLVLANCNRNPEVAITTWLGTVVSERCQIGARCNVGFGYHTYRRAVDCRIFGVRYVGWYMESSGNYCRLRKSKRQGKG
jgi:hypothetical protein